MSAGCGSGRVGTAGRGRFGTGGLGRVARPGTQGRRGRGPQAERRTNTRVRLGQPGAILSAMSTHSHRIPAKPTLDGLEDKCTQRWAEERVVQV